MYFSGLKNTQFSGLKITQSSGVKNTRFSGLQIAYFRGLIITQLSGLKKNISGDEQYAIQRIKNTYKWIKEFTFQCRIKKTHLSWLKNIHISAD